MIFLPAIALGCCVLVVCVIRSLAADIERAIFAILEAMLNWARPVPAKARGDA